MPGPMAGSETARRSAAIARAARAAHQERRKNDAAIARLVEAWPELRPEQRDRIAAVITTGAHESAERSAS